jgi:hypothetical protein
MKPDAPAEFRGELRPIPSRLGGLPVCELLPHSAQVMDRVTVVRSMTHPYPIHGVAYALTGVPVIDIPMELNPRDARHWPFIGSVVDFLSSGLSGLVGSSSPAPLCGRRRLWATQLLITPAAFGQPNRTGRGTLVPANIALPFPFSSQRAGEVPRAGPYAAFLGNAYNPIWTEFHGEATRTTVKTLQEERLEVREPYMGITPQSRFELAQATRLAPDITLDRLNRRRTLVEQFDRARRAVEHHPESQAVDRYRAMAYSLIGSERVHQALDLDREPRALRESYGMTIFGQAALTARRLVEAGSKFVTVFWDEYGLAGSGWDTHWDHYPRLRQELMPGFDLAFSGLIRDLDARGLLDETLVLVLSEHGRTPRLSNARGGGRDHWSQAYSCLLAGGGVARGRVVCRTDRIAATVTERPVSPKDILATMYHLLGIDPETTLTDRIGRPLPLVPGGAAVSEALA